MWTREAMIEVVQTWAAEGGDMRLVSYLEWKRGRSAPADVTIARIFGSWRELIEVAGFEPVGPTAAYRRRVRGN